jgi:hypothetical protein
MVIALYKRTKPKDRWMLHCVESKSSSIEDAKAKCKVLQDAAKKNGLDKAQYTFQVFDDNELHIPEFLKEIKPEKLIYN